MKCIVVGRVHQRTAVPIQAFPVQASPVPTRTEGIRHFVGGAAFASARTLAALGNEVFLAAPLGEDYPTALVDTQAFRFRISTHLCPRILQRTPRAVVLCDPHGHCHIMEDPGDDRPLSVQADDLQPELADADLLVITDPNIAPELLGSAADSPLTTAVDLQAVTPDIFVPTSRAYQRRVAPFRQADIIAASAQFIPEGSRLARFLAASTAARIIIITQAENGCLVMERDERGEWPSGPTHLQVSPVPAVAGLDAGDTFLATFAHRLIVEGNPAVAAASYANRVTAAVIAAAWNDFPGGIDQLSRLIAQAAAPDASTAARAAATATSQSPRRLVVNQ